MGHSRLLILLLRGCDYSTSELLIFLTILEFLVCTYNYVWDMCNRMVTDDLRLYSHGGITITRNKVGPFVSWKGEYDDKVVYVAVSPDENDLSSVAHRIGNLVEGID